MTLAKPPVADCRKERWLVVGRGAIGLLAASRLALHQVPVQLWLRQPQSLSYRFSVGQQDFPMQLSAADTGPWTKVLIPVKAYDVVAAVQALLPYLAADAQLILCHNGMGTLDPVSALLSSRQGLWFASTTQGAYKPTLLQIRHTGFGETILAPVNHAAQKCDWPLAAELGKALGPLQQVEDITPFLWRKLAINAVINPLTALQQCRNGVLLQAEFQPVINRLIAEFVAVAACCGQQFSESELKQHLVHVQSTTAGNYSSMQQDVAMGRKTELGAITGFLLQQAKLHQLDIPHHQQLYDALTAHLARWQY